VTELQRICPNLRLLFCSASLLAFAAAPAFGQAHRFDLPPAMNSRLRAYLQKDSGPPDKTFRYAAALVDGGNAQKEEVMVYLSGRDWCGTGGCSLLILQPQGSSFQKIGYETTVRLPIRALHTESKGRTDIGVWKQWSTDSGNEDKLEFDGKQYMTNRTGFSPKSVTPGTHGDILIPKDDEGTPLFAHN
jgi:hypothetical protein